jgi:hypothetical protein
MIGIILLAVLAATFFASAVNPRTPVLRGLYWWRAGSGTSASGFDRGYIALVGAMFLAVSIFFLYQAIWHYRRGTFH